MAQLAQDNFNRANGALGAYWAALLGSGGIVVLSDAAVADGAAGGTIAYPDGVSFPNNQYAQVTIPTFNFTADISLAGVAVRVADFDNCYFFRVGYYDGSAHRELFKRVAGISTTLASDTTATSVGAIIKLSAVGTTIAVTVDGTPIFSVTDADLAAGVAGIYAFHDGAETSVRMDDFEAGNTLAPTVSSITADEGEQGETLEVTIVGTNFDSDAAAVLSFSGTGITVDSYVSRSTTQVVANITISGGATVGARNVVVTNPSDNQAGTLTSGFEVTAAEEEEEEDGATYEGYDVLEVEPNDTGEKEFEYTRSLIRHDSRTGGLLVEDRSGVATIRGTGFVWLMDGRTEVREYQDWIAARSGALVPFWVPTWRHDLIMAADLVSGVSLSIVKTGYNEHQFPSFARRRLAVLLANGGKYYRKVEAAVDEEDGTETLTLDDDIPELVAKASAMVSFLQLCRLAVDDPELVWHTRLVAEAVLDFVELPQEVAALEVGS